MRSGRSSTTGASGLGWLSGMRTALQVVFELPQGGRPGFVLGKLRDLLTLLFVGSILLVSVALSGVVTRFSSELLDLAGLDQDLAWTVDAVAVVIALLANTLFFFVLFEVLAQPRTPRRSPWQAALLGAVAFELLKQLSGFLLARANRETEATSVTTSAAGPAQRSPARSARTADVRLAFGAGAATALGVVALVRRRRR
jgi:membrane protein